MDDTVKLKSKRAVIRQLITKTINKIDEQLLEQDNENKISNLHDSLNQLIDRNNNLKSLDLDIEAVLTDPTEFETEVTRSQEYQDKFIVYKGKIERFLKKFEMAQSSQRVNVTNTNSDSPGEFEISSHVANVVKLPKIEIKKFYGEPSDWYNFWNTYNISIHTNDSLSKIQKFNYLKMYLGGNALSAVSGFAITESNYDSSIELLSERFGRNDLIISSHVNKLLSIDSVKNSSNIKGLRKLYDEVETHIRSLQSLNVTAGSYGNLLCPIILQKLPDELSLDYNRKRKSNINFDIDELIQFIRKEVECREASFVLSNSVKKSSSNFDYHDKERTECQNRSNQNRKYASASALVTTSNAIFCVFCNCNSHDSRSCNLTIDKKKQALRDHFRCFRCLKRNHVSKRCRSKYLCKFCKRPHNSLICDRDKLSNDGDVVNYESSKDTDVLASVSASCVSKRNINEPVYLQTSLAYLVSKKGSKLIRILYDSGSHCSFIKRSLCNELNLETIKTERLQIFGFGEENSKQCSYDLVEVKLQNRTNRKMNISLEALVVERITYGTISAPTERIRQLAWGKNVFLSDTGEVADVDILIGSDYMSDILFDTSVRLDKGLIATDSLFGFVVQGRYLNDYNSMCNVVNNTVLCEVDYKLFWELEGLGIDTLSEDSIDNDCTILNKFKSDLHYDNNRYCVRLLWRPDTKHLLKNNFELASERFDKLKRRFKNDPELFREYSEIIKTYEGEGIIEKVVGDDKSNKHCYLPHRAVVRKDKSTSKVRIVFDGSAHRKNELSLNDCLFIGPNLYPDIFELILSFRENKIAFTADIKQAFLQLIIHKEDRDVTRFFWSEDPWNDSSTVIYRFCRVLFGINCSPFLLAATIKEHIKKYAESKPLAYDLLNRRVYVDDVIGGCDDIDTALQLSSDCVDIFRDASMLLRKFQTNNRELRELWKQFGINVEEEKESICQSAFPFKVLGICWDSDKDLFYFESDHLSELVNKQENSKRFILKIVGRIFDPVGFLGPFTVLLKCLIQNIWKRGLEWDQKLPLDLEQQWYDISQQFKQLNDLTVPRYYFLEFSKEKIKLYQLHIFSDAGLKAYGTVAYLRTETSDGFISTSFVAAKSRVAPLKVITLPRLELLGALLSVRLYKNIIRALKQSCEIYFWCDSAIVCCWVKTPAINFKQFIRNRVKEIQEFTRPKDWYHCPGKDNPADLISRGTTISVLKNSSTWWRGPEWLSLPNEMWPKTELKKVNETEMEYLKCISVMECVSQEEIKLLNIANYSKLSKVIRVVAWIKRFLSRLQKVKPEAETLTADEVQAAEEILIMQIQSHFYKDELQALHNNSEISPKSHIFKLVPFLDDSGILRSKGRFDESDYSFDERKPIIIPKHSKFAELLAKQEHENQLHSGIESTLVQIRRRFWIPKGRQLVKKVISKCLTCRRYTAKPSHQLSGQVPKDRISETPPFTVIGTDFAGPIYVKYEDGTKKSYIALFTCAVTRAIHLELVTDMSTAKFLLAFRRFLSRRGTCHTVYSDNAKSFKCTDRELQRLFDVLKDSEFRDFLASKRITWKFIVELAPWWGGFYERLVKSVKEPLKKSLRKALLSFEELTTLLSEIETVINLRPLSYVNNEIGEPEPLTPAHFLFPGRSQVEYPIHFIETLHRESTKGALTKRQEYQSRLLCQLWKRWKELYLLNLRTMNNMTSPSSVECIKKGDVVLLEGTSKSKFLWDLGVVKEVFQGRDGLVRSCVVHTSKGDYKRPIQLIYPLELKD